MESNTVISAEKNFGFGPEDIKRAPKDRDELNKVVRPSLTLLAGRMDKAAQEPHGYHRHCDTDGLYTHGHIRPHAFKIRLCHAEFRRDEPSA